MEPLKRLSGEGHSPLVFVILDGVALYRGQADGYPGNALDLADAPTIKGLLQNAPVQSRLKAHGTAVGMPSDADMGNSEVGHNAMGAGRVFSQGASLVSEALSSRKLFSGEAWQSLIGNKDNPGFALTGSALHFIGLLSDGNVHSHIDHLIAMLEECGRSGVERLFVHVLLDGRDVEKTSAERYIDRLELAIAANRPDGATWSIASGGGRQKVTMDRYEADWSLVELGWKTHVKGEGRFFPDARAALRTFREEFPGAIDQDLPAFIIGEGGKPVGPIAEGDCVIFFNFRGDRAIEISRAFTEEPFSAFVRDPDVKVHYAGMMQYDGDLKLPEVYLVEPPSIEETVSEYLVQAGLKQFACSETQKFGHVTYFWNGNNSRKFSEELEVWVEIPSDRISFDQKPEMKAQEITRAVIAALQTGEYSFLRLNYANGDMVGHTGNLPASIRAVEAVDQALSTLLQACDEAGALTIITADHGNCDEMLMIDKRGEVLRDSQGQPIAKTSHTLNPVPFILTGKGSELYRPVARECGLANLAATILLLLGFEKPAKYAPAIVERR
ncbi:MAG: 2,3-bisphosphoglycerate-independent phosphoglycerate mutase [Spirochaetales bacterium]|nr:2,3-bisphosphoglycerate-independent phosphoglycerate mutase [Spirochaetales bacterium]